MNNRLLKGPTAISIDITNNCNLRCLHCYNSSGENIYVDNELTDDELIKLMEDIILLKPMNICFCGGEPLLKKDILIKLVEMAYSNDIYVSMVTNGILLDENTAKRLKSAGINNIQVSIDGIGESHDKLRGQGCYDKTIKALQTLFKLDINSSVAFSPTSWGIDDFKDVFKLCADYNVLNLRVQALMPMGRGDINKYIMPSNKQYRELRRTMFECNKYIAEKSLNLEMEWGDPIEHLICSPKYNNINNMISIKANGNITPSVYLPISVGNVRKHKLSEYWSRGLNDIWNNEDIKKVSMKYRSTFDLSGNDIDLPKTFLEEDLDLDIIENIK